MFIKHLCRLEKKAIHGVINMTVPEQSKTYSHEDLSMTVVKINLSMKEEYLQIPAPRVSIPCPRNAKGPC